MFYKRMPPFAEPIRRPGLPLKRFPFRSNASLPRIRSEVLLPFSFHSFKESVPMFRSKAAFGFAAILGGSVLCVLSGCGANEGTMISSITTGAMSGAVHGVPNPVVGATVTLYETQVGAATGPAGGASGYGNTTPKQLAQTTTGNFGQFSFTAGYTCDTAPYMQYAYVVVTGGNTGGGTNNNAVLMAALGPCSTLGTTVAQNATQVYVSEATTVASAYALGNFMTVSGALGSQVVNISSTTTNDASTPACANVSGLLNSCVADGLGHAFTTAVNLASGVGTVAAPPTGLFNSTIASYPGSVIPAAMLNVVASAVQSCVNSTGGAVTSGTSDGSACGNLFAYTTPAGGNAPSTATAPTDTLSAMIDLAKYPANATATGSAGIFSLASAFQYYAPQLALAPNDYSLGIYYPGTSNGTTYAPYSWALALDDADTVYVLAADGTTPNTYGATPVTGNITTTGLMAISQGANGPAPLYAYTAGNSTTLVLPGSLAVDSQGNVYMSNPAPSPANLIRKYSAATGTTTLSYNPAIASTTAPINFPGSVAVDKNNQLWTATQNPLTGQTTYVAGVYEIPLTGTPVSGVAPANSINYSKTVPDTQGDLNGISIDAYQNVWTCGNGSGTNGSATGTNQQPKMFGFPNTGGTAGTTFYSAIPPAASGQLGGNPIGGPALDASGDIYCPNRKQIMLGVPVSTGAVAASPTVSIETFLTGAAADVSTGAQIDGSNNYLNFGKGSGRGYISALTVPPSGGSTTFSTVQTALDPCFPQLSTTDGATYCSDNATAFPSTGTQVAFSFLNSVNSFQIDSTGSAWVTIGAGTPVSPNSPNGVMQLIGPTAPVWPQLSYTKPGVKP
jgi:hypothetical protein